MSTCKRDVVARDETETFSFQSETETFPHFAETETRPRRLKNTSRDRDVETETTTLILGTKICGRNSKKRN